MHPHEPLAGFFEPLGGRGPAEPEERRLVQVEGRAAVVQPADHPVAPPGQAEHVPVAHPRDREPGQPRGAHRDVVELLVQHREDAGEGGDELRGRGRVEAVARGQRRDHAPGARPGRLAEPPVQVRAAVAALGRAAFRRGPLFEPRLRRGRALPQRVGPAHGRVHRLPGRAVHAGQFGPPGGPRVRVEVGEVGEQPALELVPAGPPVVAVQERVGGRELPLHAPARRVRGSGRPRGRRPALGDGRFERRVALRALPLPAHPPHHPRDRLGHPARIALRGRFGCALRNGAMGLARLRFGVEFDGRFDLEREAREREGLLRQHLGDERDGGGCRILHAVPERAEGRGRDRVYRDPALGRLQPHEPVRTDRQFARQIVETHHRAERVPGGGKYRWEPRVWLVAAGRDGEDRGAVGRVRPANDQSRARSRFHRRHLEPAQQALLRCQAEVLKRLSLRRGQDPQAFVARPVASRQSEPHLHP